MESDNIIDYYVTNYNVILTDKSKIRKQQQKPFQFCQVTENKQNPKSYDFYQILKDTLQHLVIYERVWKYKFNASESSSHFSFASSQIFPSD